MTPCDGLEPVTMRVLHILASTVLAYSCASAADEIPRRTYEITTETRMPHLEENLRYTDTHEHRCLTQHELWSAFPILHHPALKGCTLHEESREEAARSYALSCELGKDATGRALWSLGSRQYVGTLNVKLGGKNMTFSQRVIAKPLGECERKSGARSPPRPERASVVAPTPRTFKPASGA